MSDRHAVDHRSQARGWVSHAFGRLAALLGQPDTAEQHFARAWRIDQTMRATFYTAETGLYSGRMLIPSNPDPAHPGT